MWGTPPWRIARVLMRYRPPVALRFSVISAVMRRRDPRSPIVRTRMRDIGGIARRTDGYAYQLLLNCQKGQHNPAGYQGGQDDGDVQAPLARQEGYAG